MERSGKEARVSTSSKPAVPGTGQGPLVSNALRSAYEEAVKEEVPAEFLDLLNKLS